MNSARSARLSNCDLSLDRQLPGAAAAALAGVLCALWLRYTGPAVTLSFDIMLDILLMVVIGGMGHAIDGAVSAPRSSSSPKPICRL